MRVSLGRMQQPNDLGSVLDRISARLDAMDAKLDSLSMAKRKSLEWIAQMSQHIGSLDAFREEVRATLEPLYGKLESMEDSLRILRHATSDVSRRVDSMEHQRKKAAGG